MIHEGIVASIEKYGTPLFIFDVEKLHQRVNTIKKMTGTAIQLCYSIKANPFLIPAMLEVVDKLEVCSPGELSICRTLGVDPHRIVYSGVNKTEADIEEAIVYGVGIFTAESLLHVNLINQAAIRHNMKLPLLMRLTAGNQFGMSESDLLSVIENRMDYSGIDIKGIHYFVGTQRKKLQAQKTELQKLRGLYEKIKNVYNVTLDFLEYGPGLAVPYFEGDDFENSLKPMEDLKDDLKAVTKWTHLTVEMGRFFVSECGYYITSVMDQKSNEGIHYCILDGGIHHLNYYGQMMGMKKPVIQHIKQNTCTDCGIKKEWSLFGSLCTTADVIVKNILFNNLERGDVLVFENTGAYSVTEGIALFLSRTMPRILLYYAKDDIRLARDFIESSTLNTVAEVAR